MAEEQLSLIRWSGPEAIQILQDDPEPRMSIRHLAAVLGYKNWQALLRLAKRHEKWLLRLGRIVTMAIRHTSGGNEWEEPWYTEAQCLYLTAKSETENANEITIWIIKEFELFRKGMLVPFGPETGIALKPEFDRLNERIDAIHTECRNGFMQVGFLVSGIKEGVDFCVSELEGSRAEPTAEVIWAHKRMIREKYNGECPICRDQVILVDNEFAGANFHHQVTRSDASFASSIYTCKECHQKYHNPDKIEFRITFMMASETYHSVARKIGLESSKRKAPPCKARQDNIFLAVN